VGRRVLMVNADLYESEAQSTDGMTEERPGLADLIAGTAEIDACIQVSDVPLVDVLPRGRVIHHPADLLAWRGLADFLGTLSVGYDQVLIDCPPFLEHAEVFSLAGAGGGGGGDRCLLCVIEQCAAESEQIERVREAIHRSGLAPLGLIVNRAPISGLKLSTA
jgi:Mrp family chromosome partitioning ATPase